MLTMTLFLIEHHSSVAEAEVTEDAQQLSPSQTFARFASLLLFYATFSPRSPNDVDMQKTHECLVSELEFIPKALKILAFEASTSTGLALSLIRNVHNLLVSYAGTAQAVQQLGLKYDPANAKARWSPKPDDNTDGLITYPSIFRDILIWSLNSPDLPPFPGPKDDRRTDLVVEIIGIIYAMGGTEVQRALRYPCPNESLSQLVITSLQTLDSADERCYQVKLSTIKILMDACPSFANFLVEHQAVNNLLEITEQQIDSILDTTKVDPSAAAALVPSLAVLYKFSSHNLTFKSCAKDFIFPPNREENFRKLTQEQQKDAAGNPIEGVQAAKNMHPLDAPRGTLRWKLIRLMTWPESHIKRYDSELLWILCNGDPKEFVWRTGLGNAMAFLGAKGLVQLPPNAQG
jgi:hypothetical protein